MKTSALLCACFLISATLALRAEYQDIVTFFDSINHTTTFPVQNRNLDAVESAFGVRQQTTTGLYDWHRGIDIDGALDTDRVYAVLPGYFYDYRWTDRGGYITILYHKISDFNGGAVASIPYDPDNDPATANSITRFYTWYMHLSDDGIDGNGTGSYDEHVSGYVRDDPVAQGTIIGILGNTGSPGDGLVYGPHLHLDLRIGTTSSLEFQQAPENNVTQWGYDPHMNPMLLFDPDTFGSVSPNPHTQSIVLENLPENGGDMRLTYSIDNDETPLLNEFVVRILENGTNEVLDTHVLNFNTREGFDPSTQDALDTPALQSPHLDPIAFGDSATAYATTLVIPHEWIAAYADGNHSLEITATDLWGDSVLENFAIIPEPGFLIPLAGLALWLGLRIGRRPTRRWNRQSELPSTFCRPRMARCRVSGSL